MFRKALLYWNTVRRLKPVQLYGQVKRLVHQPRLDTSFAPHPRLTVEDGWILCARSPSMVGPNRFRFLGMERDVLTPLAWNRADWPKLWLYNAHYFDDLAADSPNSRAEWHRALLKRWVGENPPGEGNGWEPYPTSRRIVNWVKWAMVGNALDADAMQSLAVQARVLEDRMEWHLMGNHIWANAKALLFAGAFFDGTEAERWLTKGLRILEQELAEQVLHDGGHFERSPMYHATQLEDVLDMVQLAQRVPRVSSALPVERWKETARNMLLWLRYLSHPDGDIAFFNDAALGIAPRHADLLEYARQLGVLTDERAGTATRMLTDSGFARLESGGVVLLADVGSVGPDYIPGHAHAGSLSFELSVHGRRVLVNSGTSTYAAGPDRLRERGTASHNTVVVDGRDSSEVWSSFRVARRARVHDVVLHELSGDVRLSAAHDGYERLRGRVRHRRHWQLQRRRLVVTDTLSGRFREAESRFHFAPGESLPWCTQGGQATVEASVWHPRFGESVPNEVLVVRFTGPTCQTSFHWD